MKKYPRIYSLSTVGIIHHQENDYIFHPARTGILLVTAVLVKVS